MVKVIEKSGEYRKMEAFAPVCLVYLATSTFCGRNYTYRDDPLGKMRGQMIGAARSARQNIVEGSMRAGTSKESELRLYDVARGSLEELAGDYEHFLTERHAEVWRADDPRTLKLAEMRIPPYMGDEGENARHDHSEYIRKQREQFAAWLEAEEPVVAANVLLRMIDRAEKLLRRQMDRVAEEFCENGGFTERMSRARLERRDAKAETEDVPRCPKCGKPMHKVLVRRGRSAGQAKWGCTDYPVCNGMLPCDE